MAKPDLNYVKKLFMHLENNESDKFFEHVVENVDWTVMGTHPLAGNYTTKKAFIDATFARLNNILQKGVILKVTDLIVSEHRAVVELKSLSVALNGNPFNNTYCWIVEFDNNNMITKVRAYLDSALVQKVVDENES